MKRILAIMAALGLCGAVLAQEGGGKGKEGGAAPKAPSLTFSQIDANGDGQISKVEWLAFFAKLDANRDGQITAAEAGGAAPPPAGDGGTKKKGGDGDGKKGGKGDGGGN